ncbi:MAG: DUF3662 and FHA domain-containing protein [Acidimicrobiales bacterium]|nr:DUF3662 and FHA domain-containing protein [Acidimicrobiales bacterium]
MGLRGFERRLESMVEGVFARVFRSGLRPIEIGRKLVREMDANRSVDVRGRTIVPNSFTVRVSEEDFDRFAEIGDTLVRELCDAAREHGRDEGYSFLGPVTVELMVDDHVRTGEFRIDARMREGPGGVGAGSLLLPNNERYILGDRVVTIGRLPDCDITITDANVSRHHAEIRPRGDGFVLVDLGSTNGTRVNGVRVTERELFDGDEIAFGNTRLVFQAS